MASDTDGGPGGIACSDSAPGGFRFLSPRRKEQRYTKEQIGNVHISILCSTVTRCLPQSLRDGSLPAHKLNSAFRIQKKLSVRRAFLLQNRQQLAHINQHKQRAHRKYRGHHYLAGCQLTVAAHGVGHGEAADGTGCAKEDDHHAQLLMVEA